ncbi:SDR family oxidoreductase [Rhizobium johnstonii]|uniref:SDR family oxidoreductase n=1 Tax=Rhizobium TaxID=379 RepID=UPI00103170A6|nr:SDR family oxidoreductase [Rhizobium leguminosarum]TBF70708.1 SDR family oxidoreductase [Rhizobium leguminosarum]TBG93422.1 SDR family oxidoreductase [Rhizobium leguminosarum]TBG95958.1 SDR family oxidoreductase [Rhizobium leguminosarum]TBH28801.1 SDR family oxidoreductase [Rhizobium leguminosarum]TBH50247.1 SDR family oxidoreductase [Rhizobium leguminosarum]
MSKHALIVGATGITGSNLAQHLLAEGGWSVSGLSRSASPIAGVETLKCDLVDPDSVRGALVGLRPSHVFITAWSRQETEVENCRVNGAIVRNVLDGLQGGSVEHVALTTGTKHYLGPFESYAKTQPETPFREEQERLPGENFYYVQEDEVFAAAARDGFTWSIHRPHTLIGYAVGNAMNMAATLAVYASICRETGRPFIFPGSPQQWQAATDVTDARLLARHLQWAATTKAAANLAFNVVNGEVFRWKWLWPRIAAYFDIEAAAYPGVLNPLESQMADAEAIWDEMVRKYGLQPNALSHVASFWHSDADLGRQVETFNDMGRSRKLGFMEYQDTTQSFTDAFDRLRADRIIP